MPKKNNGDPPASILDRALLDAAYQGEVARVRELLSAGANVATEVNRASVLACAARSRFSNVETLRVLLDHGASVLPSEGQIDPLLCACHQSDDDRIRLLVERGADVNAQDLTLRGCTPLQELVRWGNVETVDLLIRTGANVHARNRYNGSTALHVAAFNGRLDVVQLLVAHGARIDEVDNRGENPSDWVVAHLDASARYYETHPDQAQGHLETLAWLIQQLENRK